jgi:hypothetical protein
MFFYKASVSSMVAQHSTTHPEIEVSNPAIAHHLEKMTRVKSSLTMPEMGA